MKLKLTTVNRMTKGNTIIVTAIALLLLALVVSRFYPLSEGFQSSKADICATLKKGRAEIQTQLDQANATIADATAQIAKIQASLNEITTMSSSFSC